MSHGYPHGTRQSMMFSLNAPLERDAPAFPIVYALKFLGIPFFLGYVRESGWSRMIWLAIFPV
jgi:hypothetical protein